MYAEQRTIFDVPSGGTISLGRWIKVSKFPTIRAQISTAISRWMTVTQSRPRGFHPPCVIDSAPENSLSPTVFSLSVSPYLFPTIAVHPRSLLVINDNPTTPLQIAQRHCWIIVLWNGYEGGMPGLLLLEAPWNAPCPGRHYLLGILPYRDDKRRGA